MLRHQDGTTGRILHSALAWKPKRIGHRGAHDQCVADITDITARDSVDAAVLHPFTQSHHQGVARRKGPSQYPQFAKEGLIEIIQHFSFHGLTDPHSAVFTLNQPLLINRNLCIQLKGQETA